MHSARAYRFLLVEDEKEAADQLRSYIERYASEHDVKIDVTWLKSAFELPDVSLRHDLILMDIDLPGIDGMDAARLLRTYDSETPLIFVTNLAQYAIKGYEVDAMDYMVKPITYHSLSMRSQPRHAHP